MLMLTLIRLGGARHKVRRWNGSGDPAKGKINPRVSRSSFAILLLVFPVSLHSLKSTNVVNKRLTDNVQHVGRDLGWPCAHLISARSTFAKDLVRIARLRRSTPAKALPLIVKPSVASDAGGTDYTLASVETGRLAGTEC